jgi:GTP-binding protein HflX
VFLVAAQVRGKEGLFSLEESLDELAQLADTAGAVVAGREVQRLASIHPGTFIGSGKLEELGLLRQSLGFDAVIFDDELSPAQLRNLERALGIKVLDRTALILDIFAMHARTREGALQVELAQYAYRLPRLTRQWTHLSRQAVGGVGLRGPGETQLEVDRREIAQRMAHLRLEIEEVRKQRSLQRRRRRRRGMPVVAIVGYTNAGKSTLLNRVSGSDVLVEDRLFATLDPTTRRVALPSGKQALLTDTVGFIQKLPTQLVAAFRATLEEVNEADLLVHVVDCGDANALAKIDAVDGILTEIGAGGKPVVIALNKIDLIDPEQRTVDGQHSRFGFRLGLSEALEERYDAVAPISAQQGVGIEELLGAIEEILLRDMVEMDVTLPYQAGDLLHIWHEQGVVEDEQYTARGVRVVGRAPRWLAGLIESEP